LTDKRPRLHKGPLFPRPVRRSRSREDFRDLCFVGRKLSLQVCTQKRKPVISPKDLIVHCKGWDTEHPGLNCTFRLKTKPYLSRLRLAQKFLSIEADAISNLANDSIRGDISSLTPGSIKKSHRKAFSKTVIVEGRRDTKVCRFRRLDASWDREPIWRSSFAR